MITVFGKIKVYVYLLSSIDSFELENTITHQKSDIEFDPVAVGNLYHVYLMDFRYMDYGEYQYRTYLNGALQETGLLILSRESEDITPEEEPNIIMYDGNENTEG